MKKYIVIFIFLLPIFLFAQKAKPKVQEPSHKIVFNIKDCKDEKMQLAIHFKDKLMLKDSAINNGKGTFVFEGVGRFDEGLYSLVSNTKKLMLNLIIDGSQDFTYNLDTVPNIGKFSIINSPENEEMLRFQRKTSEAQKNMQLWSKKYKEFDEAKNRDSSEFYLSKMKGLNAEMELFIIDLIDKNPTYLFSKLQKSYREIGIPDPPVYPDGSIDSMFQTVYYRTHYWDNFDLTDRRFLFIPSYEPKLNDYFKKLLWYQDVDTINKHIDLTLAKARPDSLMFRYLLEYVSREFELSKNIGHDAIFVHIVKTNQLAGKCNWMEEDLIKKYTMRIEDLDPVLIGKRTIELVLPDTTQTDDYSKWQSSYKMPKKYRILWFYDPTCHTCQKESKELRAVYDSLQNINKLNFDVYAVAKTSDIKGWAKYVRENNYPWLNLGGMKGNVDWTEVFRIKSNPQFYIINQDKVIILNRDIPKNLIPQFLEEYERIEARKLSNKK